MVGVVDLLVLACAFRATTKKGPSTFAPPLPLGADAGLSTVILIRNPVVCCNYFPPSLW